MTSYLRWSATERLSARSAPLVCLEGQPKSAAHRLLAQLAEAGATLLYHGDFDWSGLAIGNLMVKRFGAQPWRFGHLDYRESPKGKALTGAPFVALWDPVLSEVMSQMGQAAHEEAALDHLLGDLGSS